MSQSLLNAMISHDAWENLLVIALAYPRCNARNLAEAVRDGKEEKDDVLFRWIHTQLFLRPETTA